MTKEILTVGHSNHSIEKFISILKQNGIEAIADVRSSPYSKNYPQFNIYKIKDSLKDVGIAYVYLGSELGARTDDDFCYVNNVVSYRRLSETKAFKDGISRLIAGSKSYRIAAMCSEREPTECHRTILVARVLANNGFKIVHILGDGTTEPHDETMLRLLDTLGLPRNDLLMDTSALVDTAYAEREKQIAYRRKGG